MQYKKNMSTFLFYDYETFGIHTSLDKPAQFACIRTDADFNIINDPECFYCYPPDDYFPDPHSILITRITPQYTEKHGMNEYNFSKKIYNILMQPNTCIIGYNNINFDDEITRNIFYRNFFDPYEWSWKNNNSRWDLLNLLRTCYALRPDGIKWSKNKTGLPSFRLSDLTKINNIMHLHAHDAMSDVYATIEMAKLVKKHQPKLFNFFFNIRKKNELYKLINLKSYHPMIYVSNFFGAMRHNTSYVLPITLHQSNKNILIAIDLFKDVKELIHRCKNISINNDCIKNVFDLGIVLLYLNRCPMLAPIQIIRPKDYNRLNFDQNIYNQNIDFLQENDFENKKNFFVKNIQRIFSSYNNFNTSSNVDLQIYNSFFDIHDKTIIQLIRDTQPVYLKNINYNFHDARLKELFFRYRARNFFNTLDNHEKKRWLKHCLNIFNPISLEEYQKKINGLLKEHSSDIKTVILLKKSLNYILKKYKTLLYKKINLN